VNDLTAPPPLRPVRGSARCAIAALALAGVGWVVRAVWQIRLSLAGMPASGPPDQGEGRHRPLLDLENGYHVVSSLGNALMALCAVTFLAWLFAVRGNARVLSGRPPRYAWPWMYAGWIVPIGNLWVPRGIVADVHRASSPEERLPRAVNWWWGLWLLGMLSGVSLTYTTSTDDVIERAYTDAPLLLAADAAIVGAAVAAIFVVRALTSTQQRLIDAPVLHDTAPAPLPAAEQRG
jgi:hypothetical protein